MSRLFYDNFKDIVSLLNSLRLQNDVILIGSWVELFYEELIDGYKSEFATMDIDFFYPNVKKPGKNINLIKELEDLGYLYDEDIFSGKTKFYNSDGIEIEFLTKLNRENTLIKKIESINVNAECLKFMDVFEKENFKQDIDGAIILIPKPAAYVIQKLIINKDRREDKQLKDINAVKNLLSSMLTKEHYVDDLKLIYESLSKKQKIRIINTCLTFEISDLISILT